jgi:hypothetical protein
MTTDEVRQALDQLAERWRQHPGEVFTDVGQASFNWFTQALQLRRGAELLEPEMLRNYEWYLEVLRAAPQTINPYRPPVYGPYTLLAGLSLELLAKAILIERNPTLVDGGRLSPWPGGGHALLDLLRETGISLDDEDAYLAERLGQSVVWAGRYPVPKKAEQMAPHRTPQGELASPGDFHPDRDPSRIARIWDRLKAMLIGEWVRNRPMVAAAWHAIETGELPGLGGQRPTTSKPPS